MARDYRSEYLRRVERGRALGLTRTEAVSHGGPTRRTAADVTRWRRELGAAGVSDFATARTIADLRKVPPRSRQVYVTSVIKAHQAWVSSDYTSGPGGGYLSGLLNDTDYPEDFDKTSGWYH
ncbi:MAG: hypothetical protein ACRDX8_12805 [Acidimicrobiales bacterium]